MLAKMGRKSYTANKKEAIDLEFNENTRLIEILKAYPGLERKLKELDSRFSIISSPMGKLLMKTKTVKDVSNYVKIPVPDLLSELDKIIHTL